MRLYPLYTLFTIMLWSCVTKGGHNASSLSKQAPTIRAIYPTKDSLPENLLRFYVEFSNPMKTINNLENIKLINDQGREVKGAIFNNVYELWDNKQKQLTLILDPSRVKTGLIANQRMGRALKAGKHFQLVISKAEDIYGNILRKPFVKDIYVTPTDAKIPDIKQWQIYTPKANSKTPLLLKFPQVLDQMSLLSRIGLVNKSNQLVKGQIKIQNNETTWQLTPKHPWVKGTYTLLVNSRLEDPAGNNLNGLFDHTIGSLKNNYEGKVLKVKIDIR